MIFLITGAVNQGKSTYIFNLYQKLSQGDGFYNHKIYEQNRLVGQEIVHFATGETRLLSAVDGFLPQKWCEECRYGRFSFSKEGLDFGRNIIRNALSNHIQPIFVDEIGPLEINGNGFSKIVTLLLSASVETYLVVREKCLESVINKFEITEYELIKV